MEGARDQNHKPWNQKWKLVISEVVKKIKAVTTVKEIKCRQRKTIKQQCIENNMKSAKMIAARELKVVDRFSKEKVMQKNCKRQAFHCRMNGT